jgi:hypothetical protein
LTSDGNTISFIFGENIVFDLGVTSTGDKNSLSPAVRKGIVSDGSIRRFDPDSRTASIGVSDSNPTNFAVIFSSDRDILTRCGRTTV